ncbi:MAG: methionyl-tRNA formyltransferase [Dehalococcoidia bacterium]
MKPSATRVVFMGSPAFAVPSLRALVGARYDMRAVVTQPDRPAGRGGAVRAPEVKLAALAMGLDVLQPETLKDEATQASLRAFEPDVLVVAAYGKILPRAVLEMPSRGSLNVHASLLPRWRGASPIAAAIAAGDEETGVSIMEMAAKMDAGAVVLRRRMPIGLDDTTGTLEPRLAELGAEALVEALPGWYERDIVPEAQDEGLVTYCRLLKKEDGHLSREMTAVEAERAVRAYNPWPGAYVEYEGTRLGIWRGSAPPGARFEESGSSPPARRGGEGVGALVLIGKEPGIVFREGVLVLEEVQREGGKRLSGRDFVNGMRGRIAERVGLA